MKLPKGWIFIAKPIRKGTAIEIEQRDLILCGECKHYDTESRTFPCCTDISGAVRYMEADGFCSKGERRADEHR